MPYKRVGRKVYHLKSGHWRLKQMARNVTNAKKTIRLLYGLEHGLKLRKRR